MTCRVIVGGFGVGVGDAIAVEVATGVNA